MSRLPFVYSAAARPKAVAFTFDDGPNPTYTPQIMDILEEHGGKATFYMIGEQIERYPDVAREALARGHEIGNHTFTHPHLPQAGEAACRDELVRTRDLIRATVGTEPATFRPPFFDADETVARVAAELGYPVMIGAVNTETRDWEQPGVSRVVDRTLDCAGPGSVLLFHDGFGDRSQTVEAVRRLAAEFVRQGYALVTVSELLEMAPPNSRI